MDRGRARAGTLDLVAVGRSPREVEASGVIEGEAQLERELLRPGCTSEWRSGHCMAVSLALVCLCWLVSMSVVYDEYEAYKEEMDFKWGFLVNGQTEESMAAPIWIGEFGTDESTRYWKHFLRHTRELDL